jgi:FtsP/CotA-like multicopper oxidase with cupredoxin domain
MRRSALALSLAFVVLGAACSGSEDDGGTTGTGDGEQAAAGAPVTLDVTLTDFKIDPANLEAPAGSAITFSISNQGQAPHTFAVTAGDQTYETAEIQAGGTDTLEVPALEAGTYETLCTVVGHAELGMVGTLTVGDGAGEPTDTSTGAAGGDTGHGGMTAEEMAAGHEQGVVDFVGQIENGPLSEPLGNQPMKPTMDGDVKVFDLTVTEMEWEVRPGETYPGMAFNGQIPGPLLEVFQGDTVRFEIQNQMTEPFTLHFHGLTVPNDQDGVPYVTQPPIMPGEYWTYEFPIVDPPGMYVYHSHFNSAEQVGKGLYGALNVVPKAGWQSVYGQQPDVEYTLFLGDGPLSYTLNGKSFPATEPIVANEGDDVLIHIANDGAILHPMHLHGFHFEVVAIDGFPLPENQRYLADTLVVAPGSRYDIMFRADYPGAWAYHCHILPHAEGPDGMFGMVTAVVVV